MKASYQHNPFTRTFHFLIFMIIIFLFWGNTFPVSATTPVNTDHGIKKDEDFVIYLPWKDSVIATVGEGNLYGGGLHIDSGHNQYYAIDFNLQPHNSNQAIYPAQSGYVVYAGLRNDGLGKTVIMRHDYNNEYDYYTLYGHLHEIYVTVDTTNKYVRNSTSILGTEGKTGGTPANPISGEHLHFALFKCKQSATHLDLLTYKNDRLCQSVVPEPIIGKEVYEGFGLSTFNRQAALIGIDPVEDSPAGPPSAVKWESTTTTNASTIIRGEKIKFSIENLPDDVKEVRFTAWYENWANVTNFDDNQVWRIVNRRWPVLGQTKLAYEWDPYVDLRLLTAPWMPAGNLINLAAAENSVNAVCISFDVFDDAGNVSYAPGGVHCGSQSATSTSRDGAMLSAATDSARLIYISPTLSYPNDNILPTGFWTGPSSGQSISSSTVTLSVNASDNSGGSGVREVRWAAKYNGSWYGVGTDYDAPYSINWDWCAVGVQNGDVELGFEVWDNASNKWVYSEHAPAGNIHINKNYNCGTGTSGSINWSTHFYSGFDHWWNETYTGGEMCSGSFNQGNLDQNYGDNSPCSGNGTTNNWVGDYKATVNFLPGDYAFWVDHDDWLKLKVDGREIYSVNGTHSEWKCVDNDYLSLSGNHNIWVILAEEGGQARVKVEWSKNNGVCDLPASFSKSSPLNGVGEQSINPVLSWAATTGAKSYSYCIDTTNDNSCDNPNWYGAGSATSVTASNLTPGTTYYWQVKAYSQGGAGREANDGTWWSFTTQFAAPGAFNKISPVNAATAQPTTLSLDWNASSGASWYQYCYDTTNNSTCDNDMWYSAGTDTSAYVSDLAESTTYFWQVRASNAGGATNANGNTWWSFTTQAPPFNLLMNGGFEEGSGNMPTWWSADAWTPAFSSFTWDANQKHSGTRSLKISNNSANDARWIQTVYVQPNSDYRLSGWIKTQNLGHSQEVNDSGANLSTLSPLSTSSEGLFGTNDWTPVSYTFNTGPNTEITVAARVGMYSGINIGIAWFDDLKLELLSTPNCHSLTRNVNPSGAIVVTPAPNCDNEKYIHGTVVKLTANPTSSYSLDNWSGGASGSTNPTYITMTANKSVTANFTPMANISVNIGGTNQGSYSIPAHGSTRARYTSVNNGPVKILSTNNILPIPAERVIYKVNGVNTSFTEMMALPSGQISKIYWLPWYNNKDLDTQLRIGNVSNSTASVNVYVAGALMTPTPIVLAPGASTRQSFKNVNNGPVKIVSDQNIVAAERVIYKVNGIATSFSETMALPNNQLDTTYWLPWYNNKDLDTQLRFANVTNNPATVQVTIGGVAMTPLNLAAGESTRVSYKGVNAGPVQIVSDQNIVAAERVIYKVNGVCTSFTEMMALPASQLDTTYWLPWYNNKDLDTQLRFANTTNSTATVHVYIGGVEVPNSPFTLQAGESTRQSFVGINNGPVQIVSDQNIVAAERVIYKVNGVSTSFTEMMALPNGQLDHTYWLPWYNNRDLDTQLRFGVP